MGKGITYIIRSKSKASKIANRGFALEEDAISHCSQVLFDYHLQITFLVMS